MRHAFLLDNFEHLMAARQRWRNCWRWRRNLKVLVTSRAPLHVYGEHEFPVPPLALPDAQVHTCAGSALAVPCGGAFCAAGGGGETGFRVESQKTRRRWWRFARGWTVCRWRLNWPRRA